jgi:hypothetical protein
MGISVASFPGAQQEDGKMIAFDCESYYIGKKTRAMKIKTVYFGLFAFSVIMLICAVFYLAYTGISEGRSLFIQLLPVLVFALCSWVFHIAYRKAVRKETPLE